MHREAEEKNELFEIQFKNQVFASNPALYGELFKEEKDDIEEFTLESETDLTKAMNILNKAL